MRSSPLIMVNQIGPLLVSGIALINLYEKLKQSCGLLSWLDRILTPAFSPMNIKDMFDDMFDICSQLVLKWER
jgi:hypothetical protein